MMITRTTGHKARWLSIILLVIAISLLATMPASADGPIPPDEFEVAEVADMLLPDRAALGYLVENGWDLAENVTETDDGVLVTVIATPSEFAFLQDLGFVRLGTAFDHAGKRRQSGCRMGVSAQCGSTWSATSEEFLSRYRRAADHHHHGCQGFGQNSGVV